jgi:fatty aldehyde-generating acyl-ACP reductase
MNLFSDRYYQWKGKHTKDIEGEYSFGFLVHARGYKDIYRKYALARVLPKSIILFFMKHLWPITLSRVTGVVSTKDGTEVPGYVLGITMTADQMMQDRPLALQKIRDALYLARGRGVKIVGLGGLTASLSGGGKELLDIPIHITTGHAYTAFNITQNLFKVTEIFEIPKEKLKVAVVGAAGSVGSICAQIIARAGYPVVYLIDLKRKHTMLHELEKEIFTLNPKTQIIISDEIKDILHCDYVITATNTPEALVTPDLVQDGMVIIDDAQPSDIHSDVLKMPHVLVLEAGVVHTPGINSHFNYGLKARTDNFCCMAELLILAANQWEDHYVIHRATLAHVDEISEMGDRLGFTVAAFQNFLESVKTDKINHVKSIALDRHREQHVQS